MNSHIGELVCVCAFVEVVLFLLSFLISLQPPQYLNTEQTAKPCTQRSPLLPRLMFEVVSLSFSASVQPLLPLLCHPTLQPTPTSSRFQEKICLLAPTLTKRNTKCSPPTSTRSSGFFWAVPGAEERGEEWGRRQRGKGMCPETTNIKVKQGFSVRWTPSAGLLAASSTIREPEGPGPL